MNAKAFHVVRKWKTENPDAYDQLVEWSYKDHYNDITPNIKLYFELLRRPYFMVELGLAPMNRSVRLLNALHPLLARYIGFENPELHFVLRPSIVDTTEHLPSTLQPYYYGPFKKEEE